MKYNMLRGYDKYLMERYSKDTARTYRTRLNFLLEEQFLIDTYTDIDFEKVINQFAKIKHKNYFSQCKNAFFHFTEFQGKTLNSEEMRKIKELEQKTHKKYRKLKEINYPEVLRSINNLKNEKLKLSYQTMLCTGLRVSELAQITPQKSVIASDNIIFNFLGKGGRDESVTLYRSDNKLFFDGLVNQILNTKDSRKVFYSAVYLQETAMELGFKCHDLRRIYAQLEYKKTRNKNEVRKKLRHTSLKITNIYLRCKIKGIK